MTSEPTAPHPVDALSPPVLAQAAVQALIALSLLVFGVGLVFQMGLTGLLFVGLGGVYGGVAALSQRGSWLALGVAGAANTALALFPWAVGRAQYRVWTGAQTGSGFDGLDITFALASGVLVLVWGLFLIREGRTVRRRPLL
ncbi:hypothetical protein [Inhella gelatinilytica]|uniref:Uncharacterized protein n=1 Tax=Inhella gelatinilytica TaxID=2795030 RepID=A0A931IWL8_9BURK|nr:hypothetical protein [Inhella gelatinilytica]MBH9554167.1 hypothetical protein [Inhella gelatinilytica]